MTDDRNGGVPPPPTPPPTTPPPLATDPPPAVPSPPPQAGPQLSHTPAAPPVAPPPAPAPRSRTGLWIFLIILSFAAGVGGTILTLWLTGELWNSDSRSYPSSYGSSSSTGTGTTGTSPNGSGSATVPSGGSFYPPSASTLAGTWGEGCPGSRTDVVTFYPDGSASSDGEDGTWSLNGSYVTLNNGRQNMTLYWEMVGNDSARVRRSGDSRTRTIYRCP